MPKATLEERVETLERLVQGLSTRVGSLPGPDDWRSTIGMFAGDPVAKEVIDEALRLREEDRKQAAP